MAGKRYTFVLNFGYAESASLAFLPWVSVGTYKDAKVALLHLAAFLKDRYLVDNSGQPTKKCCTTTKTKDPTAVYCSKCGHSLSTPEFDGESFSEWLRMLETDVDTFHGLIDYDQDAIWQAGNLEGAPNQRFVYQAEKVLAAAVGYPEREELTFEEICKQRTKSKTESFTYY